MNANLHTVKQCVAPYCEDPTKRNSGQDIVCVQPADGLGSTETFSLRRSRVPEIRSLFGRGQRLSCGWLTRGNQESRRDPSFPEGAWRSGGNAAGRLCLWFVPEEITQPWRDELMKECYLQTQVFSGGLEGRPPPMGGREDYPERRGPLHRPPATLGRDKAWESSER